jgi:hypothetical protein
MKKHQRHETWSVNAPPSNGPTTDAMPQVAPIRPAYFPRLKPKMVSVKYALKRNNILLQRNNVRDGDLDHLHDTTSTQALYGTSNNQPDHRLGSSAERRSKLRSYEMFARFVFRQKRTRKTAIPANKIGLRPESFVSDKIAICKVVTHPKCPRVCRKVERVMPRREGKHYQPSCTIHLHQVVA